MLGIASTTMEPLVTMTSFDPTRAPAGRLARLGVVVPPSAADAPALARFCDRAGIDVVWVGDARRDPDRTATDVAAMATSIAVQLLRARLGLMGEAAGANLPADERTLPVGADVPIDRRPYRFGVVLESMDELDGLLPIVDDVVLPAWRWPDLETAADELRAEAVEAGRDPQTLGVAALLPVSIGRTEAEAAVRADTDPGFRVLGHPRDIGIFGTLEDCQDRVIALAHAGITDLRCILPAAPDVHDVIAQLTAVTIGTTDVLVPGSLRSPAPPPPEGWGGRPDRPPRQRVSGGSRRR